jgi:hypothetical protein
MEDARQTYRIDAKLVNRLITSAITSIIVIGGYMLVWGLNDARFKSRVLIELSYLKERVIEIGEDQDAHEHEMHRN